MKVLQYRDSVESGLAMPVRSPKTPKTPKTRPVLEPTPQTPTDTASSPRAALGRGPIPIRSPKTPTTRPFLVLMPRTATDTHLPLGQLYVEDPYLLGARRLQKPAPTHSSCPGLQPTDTASLPQAAFGGGTSGRLDNHVTSAGATSWIGGGAHAELEGIRAEQGGVCAEGECVRAEGD